MGKLSERQTARYVVRLGRHVRVKTEVDVSPAGLLSLTALVCGILLSTSVLVTRTIRARRD